MSWQARYTGPDGKERTKRFDRRVDAERWMTEQQSAVNRGNWIDPIAGRMSLADFANDWLSSRGDLRPTTVVKYRGLLNRHIIPSLGSTPLAKLAPNQIRSWHSSLYERHPSTAAGAYRLLSTICRAAVDEDRIVRTPCRVKGGAVERAAERTTITIPELQVAAALARPRYRLAIELAAWCQLRRGEILGLQRHDIDLMHGTVSIRRAWSLQEDGVGVLGPPKTEAGRRTLVLPSNVIASVAWHLDEYVAAGAESWLFPGIGGQPISPRTIDRTWSEVRNKVARQDVTFHDLRHSGLTWTAATGATQAELMHRAGHSSSAAMVRYQHASIERDRTLADALGALANGIIVPIGRTKDGQGSSTEQEVGGDNASDLQEDWQPKWVLLGTVSMIGLTWSSGSLN